MWYWWMPCRVVREDWGTEIFTCAPRRGESNRLFVRLRVHRNLQLVLLFHRCRRRAWALISPPHPPSPSQTVWKKSIWWQNKKAACHHRYKSCLGLQSLLCLCVRVPGRNTFILSKIILTVHYTLCGPYTGRIDRIIQYLFLTELFCPDRLL